VTERNRRRLSRTYWNLRLFGLPEPVKDFWLLVLTVLVAIALNSIVSEQDRQQEGRQVAIRVLCGAQQGVIDGGRAQILGSAQIAPPRFERNLILLGMADLEKRQQAARRGAVMYALAISRSIEAVAHQHGLIDSKTGRLLCARLVDRARAK
jgi:hypothetical protein